MHMYVYMYAYTETGMHMPVRTVVYTSYAFKFIKASYYDGWQLFNNLNALPHMCKETNMCKRPTDVYTCVYEHIFTNSDR